MNKKLIRFDWAMKTILRDKANFDVLEGFLCALLEDDNIKILHLLESESEQKDETDKFNRVDLLIEDSQHRKIIIEIQNTRETDYLERVLYGTSKVMVENLKLGKRYKDINKVISVSILYFNLGIGDDYIYYGTTEFTGMNTGNPLIVKKRIETVENYGPKIKFIEKKIFPEYYLITVEKYKNIVRKRIDEWVYMIKNNEVKKGSTSKNIDKAEQKLVELNMEAKDRKRYERYLENLAREEDIMTTAKEEGETIRYIIDKLKKGDTMEKISDDIGLSEEEITELFKKSATYNIGMKEGKKEGKEEIAIEMIKEGETNEKIRKYIGMTNKRIDEIRKLLSNKE